MHRERAVYYKGDKWWLIQYDVEYRGYYDVLHGCAKLVSTSQYKSITKEPIRTFGGVVGYHQVVEPVEATVDFTQFRKSDCCYCREEHLSFYDNYGKLLFSECCCSSPKPNLVLTAEVKII